MQNENLGSYGEFLQIIERSSELLTSETFPEELFSVEKLEQYATQLASEFQIKLKAKKARSLIPELKRNRSLLDSAYKSLAAAIQEKESVSPAAEWFVDNYHIIESHLREIKQSLPENYYQGLPQLATGPLQGYPRVYALALALIAHTDSRLDASLLQRVLLAFQSVTPLQIGEIWALSITLKIVLVQHLTPLAIRLVSARENRRKADLLADRILNAAIKPNSSEKELTETLARELGNQFNRSTVVQLIQRLRDQEPDVWPAFDWLEKQLQKHGTNSQQVVQLEHHRQASAQVTIGNIIASMRLLSNMDWRDFFESVHVGEEILALDPAQSYLKMDFQTRDQYRHALERISKRSKLTEIEVAQAAIRACEQAPIGSRQRHIGYFLLEEGKSEFEKQCGYKAAPREKLFRFVLRHPASVYLSGVLVFTVAFLMPVMVLLRDSGSDFGALLLYGALALFPASELAISLLNHYVHFFVKPKPLPRMDLEKGIPADAGTIVVVPTLFIHEAGVRELIERLEIHFLANPDPRLHFALLGDFADSSEESLPEDQFLLESAQKGIDELNEKYSRKSEPRFHLFHRKRLWNPSEGKWIGWERKRGKLLEFNRLLRGDTNTTYFHVPATLEKLRDIQYVVTLDSDTVLPRDAVQKLVGTILHPLNQPCYDSDEGRVTFGYGILQPRISITAESANATRFARISSGNIGLDPYTTAVSDVYQDLFSEGSFTGKGLYVIDAFEKSMEHRVPENAVLSHDLFEGSFARSALVTDVELFDDYPSDYDKYSKRNHRWTRGDWQLLFWLFPWAPNADGQWARNPLPVIAKWKIFDNLRRSLVPIATLLWLSLAWTLLPGSPLLWTVFIALMYLFPVYSTVTTGQWMNRRGLTWRGYFAGGWKETKLKISQIFLTMAFLPQQAWTHLDAIARALYRMFVSKKKLLEWMTHAQLETHSNSASPLSAFLSPGPLLGAVIGASVLQWRPEALPVALPFLVLWSSNPLLKNWLRKKPVQKKIPLRPEEEKEYRFYARSTWHFFETFVGPTDHWLAPDNFQEDPKPVIAHRTSPTNIGLQLLSNSAAYDLGYVGRLEVIEKAEKTFASLERMARLNGHFFNWYDTLTLNPLHPAYVSTVDSGNLAGHLLTFKQFLIELGEVARPFRSVRNGLQDTLFQIQAAVLDLSVPSEQRGDFRDLEDFIKGMYAKTENVNVSGSALSAEAKAFLSEMNLDFKKCKSLFLSLFPETTDNSALLGDWLTTALRQTEELLKDPDADLTALRKRELVLAAHCQRLLDEMDFRFLYDESRKLFVIGYNVDHSRRDNSSYDLLASESRLASFIAIAKGDVTSEHWFRLGRKMAATRGGRALIAWTATMFEYMMPALVMKVFENTLLSQTSETVVKRQIEYGREKGVPWGISEAGYNARDLQMNYQYGPFGIPGLGLKRGLSDELVISPYSTFLAALVDPQAALENLKKLSRLGALAKYGFYESLDYTPERVPKNQKFALLRSYMAHHQGMSLVAVGNLLCGNQMQNRFHADPMVQATELLLQEKIPQTVALSKPRPEEVLQRGFLRPGVDATPRSYSDVFLNVPRTQLLSNGNYSVLVTSTGAGYSRCGNVAITRWREDATRDPWGQFFYIRDRDTGDCWSAAHQALAVPPQRFEANLAEDKVEFIRRDGTCLTKTEILVAPEDNVELRKISLTNEAKEARDFELTSLMEIVLAKPQDDTAHPAFSNLFVQTEAVANGSALLATRRPRSRKETPPWAFHAVATDAASVGSIQCETDRARFLGRGRSAQNPLIIEENKPLSNTVGSVLDPIFSLRQTIRVQPGETASVTFATGLALSREQALALIDKYRDIHIFTRESELAWTQSQVQLRHLNISVSQAHTFQKLAGRVLYLDSSLRPSSQVLARNNRSQSNLWAYGISGDLPIILTRISDEQDMEMVRELLRAHEYFRFKGLAVDLVILNERPTSYLQSLQDELVRQIRMSGSQALLDKPGGVFLRRTDLMPVEDVTLLRTVARVTLSAELGTLDEQLKHRKPRSELPKPHVPTTIAVPANAQTPALVPPRLEFFNGFGGFTQDHREYVIVLKGGQNTPAPWSNVIANESDYGFLISESGSSYTWSVNSRENRLTPWSNDPVSDPSGEVLYLRDEDSGEVWTPTPLPIRDSEIYVIRHGQGYSRFEHSSHGIEQDLQVFVAMDANVKISRLKLKNLGERKRKLSVTSYVEWVLGFHKSATSAFVIPEVDSETGILTARNPYNNEFASKVAFSDLSDKNRSFTCDRKEFIGRNGNLSQPAALKRAHLSGTAGAGLDPCAALQSVFELAPGEERTVVILLGQAESLAQAREISARFRDLQNVESAFQDTISFWERTLSAVEISTPDTAMNALVNRWLLYQTLACRVWARSAFYQSGGAFGFRDQLQDVMAVSYSKPEIAREHILKAAARQFPEGDVQHWWHPPTGRGVRTRFSDDLIWLPFVVSFYVRLTGDQSIWNEMIPFIQGPELPEGVDDLYEHPQVTAEKASLFEHCARTLDRSLKVGSHGLPLMGSGDWNDGMSRVGHEGKGESVWVAWFLFSTLEQFLSVCKSANDSKRAAVYEEHLKNLKTAIEENAWDGDWYRRAYFDDGTALGSAQNEECRIDSIAQSWAVLSKAGDPKRAQRAMAAVDEHLIRRGDGLIQLFNPPFDRTPLDPGYIKGYVPGVRENGGQYTHAAIWTLMAFAELGDGDRATELYSLLNPINHALTRAGVYKYKVEPYVIAADIYGMHPHVGRGGWTWYTGSASWMYRAALESILGFELHGSRFRIRPKVPQTWNQFGITYRFGRSCYRIEVFRSPSGSPLTGEPAIELDGAPINGEWISMTDDGAEHRVRIQF